MTRENDQRKTYLQVLINELSNSVGYNDKKYFHIQTIENIIYHFENIKSENDKDWVYKILVTYFEKCSKIKTSIDRNISKNIFDEYIDKITDYYYSNLGFVMLINRPLIYFVYFVCLVLCYVFFKFYVVIIVASFFIFTRTLCK